MIKKIIPFIYCLTPLWALGETVVGTVGEITSVGAPLNVIATDSYIFQYGRGISVAGGINAAGGFYIGQNASVPPYDGSIYAESTIDTGTGEYYAVTATGAISLGGPLHVNGGYSLSLGGAGSPVNITAGAVEAVGGLVITNAGALTFSQFVASGTATGAANIANIAGSALNITTGDFQSLDSKVVSLNVGTGAFNVANGAIENKSTGNMSVTAGAITALRITNEAEGGNPTGDLTIHAASLSLTGGDATTNPSFVSSGDLEGVISGATTLANGFDLSSMGATNTFDWTTGTLSLGNRIGTFYTNNMNSFELNVTAGDIDAGTNAIRNGTTNNNAGMILTAQNVNAAGIENLATMNITAANTVAMTGDVVNSGALNIEAATFSLVNINNSGAATFNGTGAFGANAINNLAGATSLAISGSTVTATGLISNNAGVMSVGSDGALSAMGLDVNAGTMNISGTTLNIGTSGIDVAANGSLNTDGNIVSGGDILVAHNLISGMGAATSGDMAVANGVRYITVNNNKKLDVGNNLVVNGSGNAINIDAHTMEIDGNVSVANSAALTLGTAGGTNYALTVGGALSVTGGAVAQLYTDNAVVAGAITESSGLIQTNDVNITAGSFGVQDGLWFDGASHTNGFVIDAENTMFTLNTGLSVINGGANVASGKALNILRTGAQSDSVFTMSGDFANSGTVNIGSAGTNYGPIVFGVLSNGGGFNAWTNQITGGNITNSLNADLNLVSTGNVLIADLINSGSADVSGMTVSFGAVTANSGATESGGMRVVGTTSFAANSLNVAGVAGALDINSPIVNVADAVNANGGALHQGSAPTGSLNLQGDSFAFNAASVSMGSFVADGGAGTYNITGAADFGSGIFVMDGALVNMNRDAIDVPTLNAAGDLVQNIAGTDRDGTINMMSDNFTLNANTVVVGGDINVDNFTVSNLNAADGVNITVGGNISNGLDIIGLNRMVVGGDYTFGDDSKVLAFAHPSNTHDYWTDVDFSGENPIVNEPAGGAALITVGGKLKSGTIGLDMTDTATDLADAQFGLVLKQAVTESSALWLANASEIQGTFSKLSIGFCNADGTQCINYLDAANGFNASGENLPVYLVTQDNNLYVVFDTRFGGPLGLFKLQPVVAATDGHTKGEWQSAGALDDLIDAALINNGYDFNTAVLGVVQHLFEGTPLDRVDSELYARMYDYARNGDGNVIRNFSRLFQLREANQIADSLALNTRTNFIDMSDRFIDEAIWNRNRHLNKLWIDGGYGMFAHDMDDIDGDGTRFNLALGYDWQTSDTLILGWMLHGSYTDAHVTDDIDLSYNGSGAVAGRMESDMTNLSVGGGLYFIDTLSNKARLYGDLMFDVNMIDVERNQTWVDTIKGDAMSYAAVAELGLIHDWLNQYIIGNLYVRGGYSVGFDMTEKVGDANYMKLKFDGYPILTPGYSLTAQKRVYPSAWFEFRPYATIGIEYDVLGTPDTMKYKFAIANRWTEYDTDVDPLWANAGAGVEFLGVNGLHVGLGYRYQYNATVQMHKVHASVKYRF